MNILLDKEIDLDVSQDTETKYTKAVYDLHKKMRTIVRKVRKNAETDYKYADNQYNKDLHGPYFKENDLCYMLVQCPKHKFSPRWRGEFRIKKVISNHLYVVEISPGEEKVVNISKLKHFRTTKYSKSPIKDIEMGDSRMSKTKEVADHTREESDDEFITRQQQITPKPRPLRPPRPYPPPITTNTPLQSLNRANREHATTERHASEIESLNNTSNGSAVEQPDTGSRIRTDEVADRIIDLERTYSEDEVRTRIGGRRLRDTSQLRRPQYYRSG